MNIGSVQNSSGGCDGTRESKFKTIKEDFKKLQTALKSGDLKAAQDAYAALKQDLPQKTSSTSATPGAATAASSSDTSSPSPSQPSTDLDALGTALQSGDLSAAQKAFATFKQDVQSARAAHGHHHGHHQDQDGDGDSSSTTVNSTPSSVLTGLNSRTLNVEA